MDYRIIADSCCDLPDEMAQQMNVHFVPFKIDIDGNTYVDDENLDIENYLDKMLKSSNPIKTSMPSPFDYMEKLNEAKEDNIFILTISSKLSGSYNSAKIAMEMYKEENPNVNIYLVDSKAASAGETSVLFRLYELIEEGLSFEEISKKIEDIVNNNKTYFVLESLENLIKNGRIKKTTGLVANVLNIRPIMQGIDGEIVMCEINRGFNKSMTKLAKIIGEAVEDFQNRTLVIAHVNALGKAEDFRDKVLSLYNFKDIKIIPTKGLSSGYADNGGIVIGL